MEFVTKSRCVSLQIFFSLPTQMNLMMIYSFEYGFEYAQDLRRPKVLLQILMVDSSLGGQNSVVYMRFQQNDGFLCHDLCLRYLCELVKDWVDMTASAVDLNVYDIYKTSLAQCMNVNSGLACENDIFTVDYLHCSAYGLHIGTE